MEKKTVLIVDPDQRQTKKFYLILRRDGLRANIVEQAADAIRSIQREHISVLVLDVEVKDMSWEVAVSIIKDLAPNLPIIITASQNTPELEARILRQKPFYYHIKSFGTDELLLAVQNAIEKPLAR